MNTQILENTAAKIGQGGKGILAADESVSTATKRFESVGIESTEETRREYRNILLTAPGIEKYIGGVILFEETLHQKTDDGVAFPQYLAKHGVEVGIKVDQGLSNINDIEQVTLGLESLPQRLDSYKKMGATFAKWRAVYTITDTTPSERVVKQNATDLARYARICQEADVVPIVEPEVLMDGTHDIKTSYDVTKAVLVEVFAALKSEQVHLEGALLKPSMVIWGKNSDQSKDPQEVAKMTLELLKSVVPQEMGGIFFLSGGQSPQDATLHLQKMHELESDLPWPLSFSYGRALQEPALNAWAQNREDIQAAQSAFIRRAELNSLAALGKYTSSMETA